MRPLTFALRAHAEPAKGFDVLSPQAGRGWEGGEDRSGNELGLVHDVGIPEAQDAIVALEQPSIPDLIADVLSMLIPIRLDDEPGFAVDEIRDGGADLLLTDEREAGEAPVPQASPEASLSVGFVGTQMTAEARTRR